MGKFWILLLLIFVAIYMWASFLLDSGSSLEIATRVPVVVRVETIISQVLGGVMLVLGKIYLALQPQITTITSFLNSLLQPNI